MKVLIISPLGFSITSLTRYAGIEKLAWQFSVELSKNHKVSVLGHADSIFPQGITNYPTEPIGDIFLSSELRQYQRYHHILRDFDVIHDFSHQHFASRFNYGMKSVNPFWHAPSTGLYPKSPYNIIGLSQWAVREFKRYYHQNAIYQNCIIVDTNVYKPLSTRTDRLLTLGKMSAEKGNLNAILLCKKLGVPLDVAGAKSDDKYEAEVKAQCDSQQIVFHGEVSDEKKMQLLQTCRALIYFMPQGYEEVTSHKVQEALLCGAGVVATRAGALPEIITQGVDGWLCSTDKEFEQAVKDIDKLQPEKTREATAKKYSIENVVAEHIELYQKVAEGLRW